MAKTVTWRNTPFAHQFYHSAQWQRVRKLVLDRAHGLCEKCLERGVVRPADVVHHVVPLSPENAGDPSISLNQDNLVALCDDCHTRVHKKLGIGALNGAEPMEPRVGFDENGDIVPL